MLSRPPRSLAARIEPPGGLLEVALAGQDRGDVLVLQHRRQPVRAEQEDVAGAGAEGHRVDVDLRLGTERAGDHRALRMLGGLIAGQLPLTAQLLDQRVVVGDLLELALAEDVGAAVADVAEADLVAVHERRGQRRPHPRARRVPLGEVEDLAVGLLGGPPQQLLRGARRPRRPARTPRPPSARRPRRPARRPSRRRPRTAAPARSTSPRWPRAGARCRSAGPTSRDPQHQPVSRRRGSARSAAPCRRSGSRPCRRAAPRRAARRRSGRCRWSSPCPRRGRRCRGCGRGSGCRRRSGRDPDVGLIGAADRDPAEQVDALAGREPAALDGDQRRVGGGHPAAGDRVHPGPVLGAGDRRGEPRRSLSALRAITSRNR